MTDPARDTFSVFGTTAVLLVTDPAALGPARAIMDGELAAVDKACSRFRPDSELSILNGSSGRLTPVSELFGALISAALRAAAATDGDVDPTVAAALIAAGYDRDFAELRGAAAQRAPVPPTTTNLTPDISDSVGLAMPAAEPGGAAQAIPGWRNVYLDPEHRLVRLDAGARLDLGATAKSWAADRCAGLVAANLHCGVLVSLGGDIAVGAGPPPGGWRVRVTDDHAAPDNAPGQTVSISSGGLATSSTTVRTWSAGGRRMNHIIDPATGEPVESRWRTVSVAAATCVDANTAATAAIIRSERAEEWLSRAGLPARLVGRDGSVRTTAGWPADN